MTDFEFTGHYYDRPTGLILAQYRGYDPHPGRWLSVDPFGLRGGLNLYGYVDNNPLNFRDPTGRNPAAAAAIGVGLGIMEALAAAAFAAEVWENNQRDEKDEADDQQSRCAEAGEICTMRCLPRLKNKRPTKKSRGCKGTGGQPEFTECWRDCMSLYGCWP